MRGLKTRPHVAIFVWLCALVTDVWLIPFLSGPTYGEGVTIPWPRFYKLPRNVCLDCATVFLWLVQYAECGFTQPSKHGHVRGVVTLMTLVPENTTLCDLKI